MEAGGKKKAKKSLRRRSTQEGITEGRDETSQLVRARIEVVGRLEEGVNEEGYAGACEAPSALKPESLDYLDTIEVGPS